MCMSNLVDGMLCTMLLNEMVVEEGKLSNNFVSS
jgi:hypothetical protein